ncbi:hypothetical protein [Streptomyces erythrochromogenes]|uniref:hypothetical protein n=1 Tax=Streptomyces erythrochromogenes TaxID=285574 RepID=UPI003824C1B6
MMRRGQLPDPVAEALLTYGANDSGVLLHGRRASPAIRRRIAEHPDPAIRDAHAGHIRTVVERKVTVDITDLVDAYGGAPADLATASDPRVRAMVAKAWRDRPVAVQSALPTDPDPRVRAAATRAEHPGVPVLAEAGL